MRLRSGTHLSGVFEDVIWTPTALVDGRNRISGRRWKGHFFGGPCDPQNQREFEQGQCVELRERQEEEDA